MTIVVLVIALECNVLLRVEFMLQNLIGDGDGDRMCSLGLNGVQPDNLEPHDWIEGESSCTCSQEIICGKYCEQVQFTQGHEHSFWLQSLPSCSVVTFLLTGMTTQSFSEGSSVGTNVYGNCNCEYWLMDNAKGWEGGGVESMYKPQHQ